MRDAYSWGVTVVAAETGSCAVGVVGEVVGSTLAVQRDPAALVVAVAIVGFAVERQQRGW